MTTTLVTDLRKLNLGCGFDKRDGFVNADSFPECTPDLMMDIEETPWPIEDNQFDYVLMKHVLEHVGETFATFRRVMRELYRVTANGAIIEIHVPHFRHDTYWSDPTHVRAFTPLTFTMMSKRQNDEWIAKRANYSMIAYALGVDFEVEEAVQVYDSRWLEREAAGEFTRATLRQLANERWGVVKELHMKIRTVK
jgi:predicted SAM-dependent methyltransferase